MSGDIGDRYITGGQQLLCCFQSFIQDILIGRNSERLPERTEEMEFRHIAKYCYLIYLRDAQILIIDILPRNLQSS